MTDKILDFNEAIIKNYIKKNRPPMEIRKQLDLGYSKEGETYYLNEIRPQWNDPSIINAFPFAKIKYVKSRMLWKLYWKRSNGNWELYEAKPSSEVLNDLLVAIEDDKYGCFYG